MVRQSDIRHKRGDVLLQLDDLTDGRFTVEGAVRVLQVATLLERDANATRSDGGRGSDESDGSNLKSVAVCGPS